eukprot:jgi/Ulvmu1/4788/UM020_0073.1
MDLKQKISSLRKENRTLTKAFLWLCSGTADWDTLIQKLPQHVSQQLPTSGPPVLTPMSSRSCATGSSYRPATSDRCSMGSRPCTPAQARPQTSQANSDLRGLATTAHMLLPRTAPGSRTGSVMLSPRSDIACSVSMPSTTVRNTLLQFPALAALESEFQDLVSRPATAAEGELPPVDAPDGALHVAKPLLPPVPGDAYSSTLIVKATPGVHMTPAAVKDVLAGDPQADKPMHITDSAMAGAVGSADNSQEAAGSEGCSDIISGVEAGALLWAMQNLWFGVVDDMTEYAYKVWIMGGRAARSHFVHG